MLRSFLGAGNPHRRFVKKYTKNARHMSSMLCKDAEPDFENPTEARLASFGNLKENLVYTPILALPKLRN